MSSSNPVIEYRFYNENINYGICLTIGTVTEKKVKCDNFILQTGSEIVVRFEFTNQRENPTLNVNETGAVPIYYRGAAISPAFLAATRTYLFAYNGAQYELVGDISNIYKEATMIDSGLISPEEKYKLFTIDYNANNYSHPIGAGNRHIPSGGSEGQILRWADDGLALWGDDLNTEYSDVTDDTSGLMNPAYKKKLDSIEENANNYTLPEAGSELGGVKSGGDVTIEDGVISVNNDSHSHTSSTITDLESVLSNYIPRSEKGADNGVAILGEDGKLLASQIPGSVDDILEFEGLDKFPIVGEKGKLYVDTLTNKTYRWSGSMYSIISDSIALGETETTAYRGDLGKVAYDHSQTTGNPHNTKYSELKNIPETFIPKAHFHKSNEINQLKGYTKGTEYTSIEETDNLNEALGKLEKGLELKPDTDTTYELVTTTNAGLMSPEDKLKLNNIEEFANNYTYTLYKATDTDLGGIRTGYTQNNKNYPIVLDENGKAYVNVPWVDNDTSYTEATQTTNGLMAATDKKKLDGIDVGANNYKLPTAGEEVLGGVKIGYTQDGRNYPIVLDENGKAYVNVPWIDTNTTYGIATANTAGLMSSEDRIKLNGIAENANNYTYTLPVSNSNDLGGIKIGYEENGKNYPVELDANNKAYVAVPWTDNDTTYSEATTDNSGLMSASDKTKLESIEENANNYTLPKSTPSDLGGVKVGYTQSGKNYPVELDANSNAYVAVPWTDTTYGDATTSKSGLMSSGDKSKLDGIAANANNYTLPNASSDNLGGIKTGYTQIGKNYPIILDSNNNAYVEVPWTDTTYSEVTSSKDGLMTSEDKKKLDGIASNANNYILPTSTADNLGGIKIGYTQNGKNYPIVLDANGKAYVAVPWTDNNTYLSSRADDASQVAVGVSNGTTLLYGEIADRQLNAVDTSSSTADLAVNDSIKLALKKLQNKIAEVSSIAAAGMRLKGEVSAPITTTAKIGDTYKATSKFTIAAANSNTGSAITVNIGDTIIALEETPIWFVIPSGDEILNVATSETLGGLRIGYTQSGKNYPVQLDGNNKAYVNVPWTDNNTTYSEATTDNSGLMSASDKTKLNGIADNANNYTLPKSTADALGGVKIGYSQNGKNYPVVLDTNGNAYVNVPWADNNTTYNEATQTTAGLMPASDKKKLDGIAENANNYSLPTSTSSVLGGIKVGYTQSGKNYPIVLDTNGNAYVNVPWENTTYGNATTSADGLMSSRDKSKLNGIAAGANNYSLPTSTADALGGIKIGYTQSGKNYPLVLDSNGKAFVNVPWTDNNTTYGEATTSAAGLMSSADKTKLNGIATGANNYSLPTSTSNALGGIKIGYTQSGKNYPVVLDSNGRAYVNVPWVDTNTTYTLSSFGITATAAQLNYTSGVTSNIQTQLNAKQAKHVTRTITLSSSSWTNKAQTVTVSGVTASNTVIVGPAPTSVDLYGNAGIICTAQADNSLTFSCNIVPTSNITVNVIILN